MEDTSNEAARAFELLRGEVRLLRRGVEQLTAERQNAPDYTLTLAEMTKRIDELVQWACKVNERPALKLSPQGLAQEIERAASEVRAADARTISEGASALAQAARQMDALVARSRTVDAQRILLLASSIAMLLAGGFLGVVIG